MKLSYSYLLTLLCAFSVTSFAQVVGGRGNSQSSPKEVKAYELNKGAYNADINLFTGALSSSYTLGSVSTPSGLSFTLSLGYSSSFSGGDNVPLSTGIPYGEGWGLSLPSISVTTEAYSKYSRSQLATLSAQQTDTLYPEYTDAEAAREGSPFWLAPEVNIPGVISERFIYKYTETEGGGTGDMVFVPSKFDSYVEARLKDNVWRVITEDGTVYEFGVAAVNVRNASNQRYLQDDVSSGGGFIPGNPLAGVYRPTFEYLSWNVSKIYHPNYPNNQQIQFLYETFGEFNYYRELLQPIFVAATSYYNNFAVFKDVLLKEVRSTENFGMEFIEKIELNYKTTIPGTTYNMLLPGQTDVYRKDSLYNFKAVYAEGINNGGEIALIDTLSDTTANFTDWIRYHHVRSDSAQNSGATITSMYPHNPYIFNQVGAATDGGYNTPPASTSIWYLRSKAASSPSTNLPFNHCFLESPLIGETLPAGDIYEIRTLISNQSALEFCNFDINIVAGDNTTSTETAPSSTALSTITLNEFNRHRATSIYSTFNQAVKWSSMANASRSQNMVTSNFFSLANLPLEFDGFRIQVGPSNSDHDFSRYGTDGADMSENGLSGTLANFPDSYKAYTNVINSGSPEKWASSPIPSNFGVGLEWHMMRRIYSDMFDYSYPVGSNVPSRYRFWWQTYGYGGNDPWINQPTAADNDVQLNAVELIRYSKNPYMLSSVKTYRINGVDSTIAQGKKIMTSWINLEYDVVIDTIKNNFDPTLGETSSFANNYRQRQNIFLLKHIREIPVNSANNNDTLVALDTTKVPTTHFEYTKYSNPFVLTSMGGDVTTVGVNINMHPITKIIDRLGGETSYEYYEFDSAHTFVSRFDRWQPIEADITPEFDDDVQMRKPYTLSYTLGVKTKTIANDSNAIYPQTWDYAYEERSINHITPDYLGSHFYVSSTKNEAGFIKTIVTEPQVDDNTNRVRTEYTHYVSENNGLLFGKIKRSASYDGGSRLLEEKDYEYSVKQAYTNGIYRSNDVVANYYYLKKHYSDPYGDYLLSGIDFYPQVDSQAYSVTFNGISSGSGQIADMLFLETDHTGDSVGIFEPKYLSSYFTPVKKEYSMVYDFKASKNVLLGMLGTSLVPSTGKSLGTVDSLSPVNPTLVGSTKKVLSDLSTKTTGTLKKVGTLSGKIKSLRMDNITEYEYWDADSAGYTVCQGNKILNGDTSAGAISLFFEPSWQLYKKKNYALQLPGVFNTEEHFYFHDLRSNALIDGADTLTNFDALNLCSAYHLRNLEYETRTTSKSQAADTVVKSQYYWYDARFTEQINQMIDTTLYYESVYPCDTMPGGGGGGPTPPDSGCVEPFHGLPQYPPAGYKLVIDTSGNTWWCPFELDDFSKHSRIEYEPYQYDPGRAALFLRNIKDKLFLRYISVQVDTIFKNDPDYDPYDNGNHILRFAYNSPYYLPIYPFDTLTNYYVEERNIYGQVKIEHDAKGLRTFYSYAPELTMGFEDTVNTCNTTTIKCFRNMGMADSVIIGYGLPNQLATYYEYNKDHSIRRIIDPNETAFSFGYDEYGRLKNKYRNYVLLNRNYYHYWENDTSQTFEERARENFVETFTINNSGSNIAERSRAYIDPQGRKYDVMSQICSDYTDTTVYDSTMIHSGLTVYDNWNRTIKQYKPFETGTGSSEEKFTPKFNNPLTNPFIEQRYENTQRSKLLRSSKYGEDIFQGHTVNSTYRLIRAIPFAAQLGLSDPEMLELIPEMDTPMYIFLKSSDIDEDGNKVITYTDAIGRKVATKSYKGGNVPVINLFIYDSQGNVCKIINPNKQEITYNYNLLGQVYKKQTVDAGIVKYMYNRDGKVVLEQDANATAGHDNNGLPFVRRYYYDDFGRLIKQERDTILDTIAKCPLAYETDSIGGYHTNFSYGSTMDFTFESDTCGGCSGITFGPYYYLATNDKEKEWVYHDSDTSSSLTAINTYLSSHSQNNLKGRLAKAISYDNSGDEIEHCFYSYNSNGFPEYELHGFVKSSLNYASAITYSAYNLRGNARTQNVDVDINGSNDMAYNYGYDDWNRLKEVKSNGYKIASYNYNDALGLVTKVNYHTIQHGCEGGVMDTIQYTYDTRDRLTSITSTLYDEYLYYDSIIPQNDTAVYDVLANNHFNGNINAAKSVYKANLASNYGTIGNIMDGATYYGYKYDKLNRLTNADASVMNVLYSAVSNNPKLKYGDEIMTYDKVGNISTLKRGVYYSPGTSSPANINFALNYNYASGKNRLLEIDSSGVTLNSYDNDANGNMRSDSARGIVHNLYTRGNVMIEEEKATKYLRYGHDANDNRIYTEDYAKGGGFIIPERHYYLRDMSGKTLGIYDVLEEEWTWYVYGKDRVAFLDPDVIKFHYYIHDHLGNERVMYTSTVNCGTSAATYTIENATDYYPYGRILRAFAGSGLDRYGYQGSEREKKISDNVYYTLYRGLDVDIARWKEVDPKWNESWSPYASMNCNPVKFNDVLGDEGDPFYDFFVKPFVDLANSMMANAQNEYQYRERSGYKENVPQSFQKMNYEVTNLKTNLQTAGAIVEINANAQTLMGVVGGGLMANGVMSYAPVKNSTASVPENYVFRGDSRAPSQIFNEGFSSKGNSMNLAEHAATNPPESGYISTTTNPKVARTFAGKDGYVYTIKNPPNGVNVNNALGSSSPYPNESEIAVPKYIDPSLIRGARQVGNNNTFTGPFIKKK